jgi:hypothetical protein
MEVSNSFMLLSGGIPLEEPKKKMFVRSLTSFIRRRKTPGVGVVTTNLHHELSLQNRISVA